MPLSFPQRFSIIPLQILTQAPPFSHFPSKNLDFPRFLSIYVVSSDFPRFRRSSGYLSFPRFLRSARSSRSPASSISRVFHAGAIIEFFYVTRLEQSLSWIAHLSSDYTNSPGLS